jgi:hypothetical protein
MHAYARPWTEAVCPQERARNIKERGVETWTRDATKSMEVPCTELLSARNVFKLESNITRFSSFARVL